MQRKLFVFNLAFASAFALWPGAARAQYGYPVGYGGYGWGGWGASTGQGGIARGLAMFNRGGGFYNVAPGQARSMNVDTAMRWTQYVWGAQQNANRLHHEKLVRQQQR